MNRKIRNRSVLAVLLVVALTFGVAYFAFGDYYRDISTQLKMFNELYKKLVVNYVDQVNPEALIEAGINGMLQELDPYTVYLEREDRHGIQTLTEGEYGGVGIRLDIRNDTLTVIAPMEGGPAARAGVKSGDRIIQIDTLNTIEMRISRAASIMRGRPGSVVTITVIRPGIEDRIPFALERENIVIHDLAYADLVADGIAYLKITSFSKNSADELSTAIEEIGEANIQALVLDLRDNPGGLLSTALKVADLFIEDGTEILSTKGRTEKVNKVFHAKTGPIISSEIPMAVLVNNGSASASEIVAGILQDLDRAIIIGRETFGKGLVQSVLPISRDASIKITTAKYYIPSGRLIQKEDYFNHEVIETDLERDSVYYTHNKRRVYGGGGITPDIVTEKDTMPEPVQLMWAKNHFFQYAVEYRNRHSERNWPFEITAEIQEEFINFLDHRGFTYKTKSAQLFDKFLASVDSASFTQNGLTDARSEIARYLEEQNHWKQHADTQYWIRRSLGQEMANVYGGNKARIEANISHDETIQKALEILQNDTTYFEQLGFVDTAP
ncbi:MAG TPA: S41 family peptidase [bacterium]|nr:S41 family peptidase [bacterium]